MKKIIIVVVIVVLLIVLALLGAKKGEKKEEPKEVVKEEENYLSGKVNVEMYIKDYGKVTMELDADTAPITVTNFVNLVKEKFYDGLTFHRIISGFMAQGGDPSGDGTGGSGKNSKGEFSENGVENEKEEKPVEKHGSTPVNTEEKNYYSEQFSRSWGGIMYDY